ncbi:MAG: hypothetical protein HFG54_03220 [Lachnospiraceae bacterium]|nr:hypothetical protein [Lachnospiraceae bacterium]
MVTEGNLYEDKKVGGKNGDNRCLIWGSASYGKLRGQRQEGRDRAYDDPGFRGSHNE